MTNSVTSLVGINLVTAGHLADALDRAGRELADRAGEAHLAARLGGVPAVPAARLEIVGRWAEDEADHLRALVQRLGEADGGPVRWRGGTDDDFAHPVQGHRTGRSIVAALEAGDLVLAARLLDGHGEDPVVATVVVQELGVDHLLQLLRWGAVDDGARAVVDGLAEVLAVALRNGTTAVTMAGLAERADELELP